MTNMKRLLALLTALSLALLPVMAFADGEDVKVYLDGKLLELKDANGNTVTPVIIDGTTYLPVRAISNALDLGVEWNEAERAIYLTGENEIIASDMGVFSNLAYYADNAYELLGKSAFLNPLKAVLGKDYDTFAPTLATTYATGDANMITLHCSDRSVVDVYKDGRIDVAMLSPKDAAFGGDSVIKYYSSAMPDAVNSPGLIDFISQNVAISGYTAIDFVSGSGAPSAVSGTYSDINGFGSFTFTAGEKNALSFKGAIKNSPNGTCSSSGTIYLEHGSTVCTENKAPSILFAFSGSSLTIIGLNNVTKALTTAYVKQ